MRPALLLLALLLVAPACGRKKPPPSATETQKPVEAPKPPPIQAPREVPQALKNLVQREWDGIVRSGEAFLKSFNEATIARDNNDRSAMDVAIESANRNYQTAFDAWAKIAYWPDDEMDAGRIDEATAEICRKWLSEYNRRVDEWTKKNKALAQYSRK